MYNSGDGRICTFCLKYKIGDKFNCSDPYILQSIVSYLPKYLYPNVFKFEQLLKVRSTKTLIKVCKFMEKRIMDRES